MNDLQLLANALTAVWERLEDLEHRVLSLEQDLDQTLTALLRMQKVISELIAEQQMSDDEDWQRKNEQG